MEARIALPFGLRENSDWPTDEECAEAEAKYFSVPGANGWIERTWSCFADPNECPCNDPMVEGPKYEWNEAGTLLRCPSCGMDGT